MASLFSSLASWMPGSASAGALYYDALRDSGRRRAVPPARVRQTDRKMSNRDRRTMNAKVGDLMDNFALAAWMVRVHIDYVASISFKSTTGNKRLDLEIDEFMDIWSSRFNCHAQRKYSLSKLIRLIEQLRVCYGDCLIVKVGGNTPQRGSIQLIEPDRIGDPPTDKAAHQADERLDNGPWYNGVKVSATGIPVSYGVNRRTRDGDIEWEREVRADNAILVGYFDRHDQYRGISPFITAANHLQDVYEGFNYSLQKVKVAQALAAVITREAEMGIGAIPTEDGDGDGLADRDWEWDLSSGPKVFDLNPGEGVSVIQGSSDSMDAISLLKMMTQLCLKSLDLPMSFFSEDFSNWFGQRASGIHMERAARSKRAELIEAMNEITRWRLGMALADGDIALPAGWEFDDLVWEWVPQAVGWFDPLKEAQGYRALIAAGLDSPKDICRANGKDWEQVLADRAEFEEVAKSLGVSLDFAVGSSSSSAVEQPAQPEQEEAPEQSTDDTDEESEQPEQDEEDDDE